MRICAYASLLSSFWTQVKISLIGFSFEALDEYEHIGAVPIENKMFGTHCHKFNNVGMDYARDINELFIQDSQS